jgi:hypothetical protein
VTHGRAPLSSLSAAREALVCKLEQIGPTTLTNTDERCILKSREFRLPSAARKFSRSFALSRQIGWR